jgi:RNA polymerase sigma factor (sigma-70 family)
MPPAPPDGELAARVQAGDTASLGQLYDRHARGVHDFLARLTRDPATAEDLTHSTFLRAWERRGTLRDPSRVRAWLYATAHHLALNHVTRGRPAGSIDEEAVGELADTAPGPEAAAMARELADLVWAAAASLEPRQYTMLDLSVRRSLSTREIADVLGVPVGHAAVLANRAREALGNAVRYLLVARRRDHCERLAALVPAGVRALTAPQRSAVDHHLRRCESCRELGRRLTSPEQLLGALLPLPLPPSLGPGGRDRLVAAVRSQPWGQASPAGGPAAAWPPRRPPWDGRRRWVIGLAALLALLGAAGGAAVALRPPVAAARTPAPRASGPIVAAAQPTGAAATPAPPTSPSASGTPGTPAATATPAAAATPVPARTATPAPATPTPAPPPSGFRVNAVVAAQSPLGPCPVQPVPGGRAFVCTFAVTVGYASAAGGETVTGTVTATSTVSQEVHAASYQVAAPGPGAGQVSTKVTIAFARCPQGTTSVTSQPPGVVPGVGSSFGAC